MNNNSLIKVIYEFSRLIAAAPELSTLIKTVTEEFPKAIQVGATALILFDKTDSQFFPKTLRFGHLSWHRSGLVKELMAPQIWYIDTFQVCQDPALENELREIQLNGFNLILPLRISQTISGLFFVGSKNSGEIFSEVDILMLGSFTNQVAVALSNATCREALVKSKQRFEQLFDQKVQDENMALIGKMTSNLAHELKNYLGIIYSSAQYLSIGKNLESTAHEMLEHIISAVAQLNESTSGILNLARQALPEFSQIFLEQIIQLFVDQWIESEDHRQNIDIHVAEGPGTTTIYADTRQVAQLLRNLIRNSEEMMPDGGQINIAVEQDNENVLVSIMDNSPEILEGSPDQIFENFITAKGQKMGLELATCRQIVQAHGGSIRMTNRTDGPSGVVTNIRLPKTSVFQSRAEAH